jgi:hypothetical protein
MTDTPPVAPVDEPTPTLDLEEEDSYLEPRPTGGMHLVIDGHKRRLRPPRMRDYRKLYELWSEEADALDVKSAELNAFLTRMMALGDEREGRGERRVTDEERAEDRRLGQEIRQMTEDAALHWWAETIRTLGVTPTDCDVDQDDLPVFLAGADAVNLALNHWRKVPSRSGVR